MADETVYLTEDMDLADEVVYVTNNPDEADKFYKELVTTCPDTELGKEAEKIKWFPKNIGAE